jgi:hypothetical protein
MARIFAPIHPPNDPRKCEPWLNNELRRISQALRHSSLGLAAVSRGESPDGSGNPLPTPTLTDYWFKPGVATFGVAYGEVAAGGEAVISSTAHDTKGFIRLGYPTDVVTVDEVNGYVGVNIVAPDVALDVEGTANEGGGSMLPIADIGVVPMAPDTTHYYTANGTPVFHATNAHAYALSLDDGSTSWVGVNNGGASGTPNGASPDKLALDGVIVPGATYTIHAKVFTLSLSDAWTYEIKLVDSAGDVWRAASPVQTTAVAVYPSVSEIEVTITTSGSPNASGEVPNAVWIYGESDLSTTGTYFCWSYVEVVGHDQDIQHWHGSDDTLHAVVNSAGQFGITRTTLLGGMLHVEAAGAASICAILQGATSQTGDLLQTWDDADNPLSGFDPVGAYYLLAGAGAGYVYQSDAGGIGSWFNLFGTSNTWTAAQVLAGDADLSAADIITDTSTGTKIGTATAQKLGFWNTAPNIQPTTAITAASFTANTSAIADDSATFDGYTIGQVVAALRRAGLLA